MDTALLAFLLDMAVKFSGLPAIPVEQLPPVRPVSAGEMRRIACPEAPAGCRNLQAMFDTDGYRIFYVDTLDMDDAADNSFLVHELVHVLQHRRRGDAIYADCRALLATEGEAYRVQNAYLQREGQLLRVGEVLRFTTCAAEVASDPQGANEQEWQAAPNAEPWKVRIRRPALAASTWGRSVLQR